MSEPSSFAYGAAHAGLVVRVFEPACLGQIDADIICGATQTGCNVCELGDKCRLIHCRLYSNLHTFFLRYAGMPRTSANSRWGCCNRANRFDVDRPSRPESSYRINPSLPCTGPARPSALVRAKGRAASSPGVLRNPFSADTAPRSANMLPWPS